MDFEWDYEKNRLNIYKHGISFEEASEVFFDPFRVFFYDSEHSSMDEERWQTIGQTFSDVLFVVYIIRDEAQDVYRIISARKANAREKRKYRQIQL